MVENAVSDTLLAKLVNDFDGWVKLDLEYIDTWSLLNDFKIMLRTIPAALKGTGS